MARPDTLIGIDLSQTGLGLCALPENWELDWRRVTVEHHGHGLGKDASSRDKALRVQLLANAAKSFVLRHIGDRRGARLVWAEGYIVSGRAFGIDKVIEVGGAVRKALADELIWLETAPLSTARKLVLGKLPGRKKAKPGEPKPPKQLGAKEMTHMVLREIGAPKIWTGDEIDAFVVANFAASEVGWTCILANPQGEGG